ncbi:MAG: hypothetical protein JWQ09_5110, partial [Segetibacter sp.]|nr:hypothetical protein [Segetibacter sp.]
AFKSQKSDVFTGRPQGLLVRKDLKLDKIDNDDSVVNFIIPKETTSFNPSFYLGMLFGSLKKLGIDKFVKKYHFTYASEDPQMRETLEKNISDAWRNALNSLNKNFGFDTFINNSPE